MKHTISLLTLIALGGFSAYAASTSAAPEWTTSDSGSDRTYSTSVTGEFEWDSTAMGAAAISKNDSFTLKLEFNATSNPWPGSNYAIIPIASLSKDFKPETEQYGLYSMGADDTKEGNGFRIYLRCPNTMELYFNGANRAASNLNFGAATTASEAAPVSYGFLISYSADTDALTIANTKGSQITFDTITVSGVASGFTIDDLTNTSHYLSTTPGDGMTTTISITKIGVVPEPSAFGLLAGLGALALVASRRRRK